MKSKKLTTLLLTGTLVFAQNFVVLAYAPLDAPQVIEANLQVTLL